MRHSILLMTLVMLSPAIARAHFLWLVIEPAIEPARVQVYFGEAAEPDDPDLLDRVVKAEVWSAGGRGKLQPLVLKKNEESLTAALTDRTQQNPAILKYTYGVVTRGDSTFLLNYYAKTYPFSLPGTWQEIHDAERLPLEISPTRDGNSTVLRVSWKGEGAPGCGVVIAGPGIDGKLEGSTDEAGDFRCELPEAGTYSIRARLIEDQTGKFEDKEYSTIRHYSTLTLHNVPSEFQSAKHKLPELPQGITSFGGAIVGDTFYVYGGNYGSAHEYTNEEQSNDLWALNLAAGSEWKKASTGPRLQGLAMVAHDGLLYRVGGFTAMNQEGEEQDLQSQASVAQFNPKTSVWKELPSLPEPRSSHDAAVLGDTLYVAGGWDMPGAGKDRVWHQTAWTLDLS
ncbi:MAG: hypothetical protein HQ518_23155 [Rhodopirellula sp.]|nr:hypothetical protein [Rhodopirellula sp.]